jgi:hypothetical protein
MTRTQPAKLEMSKISLFINPQRMDKSSGDIHVWELSFVTRNEKGEVRNLDSYTRTTRMFGDLEFRAQWNINYADREVYGQDLLLTGCRIKSVSEAQELLDVMKLVEKARASFAIQPTSFGQFVVLMCQALKIKTAVVSGNRERRTGFGGYDDYDYRHLAMDSEVQRLIDTTITATFPQVAQSRGMA